MTRMWELKQSANLEEVDLYIYKEIESDYYDWWKDEIVESETSANHFKNELEKYSNVSQINIYINSNGGSVYEGTAIYNQLKRHPARKTVYIDGFACSIASVIAMAGDEIIMPRNALMMVHNMMMGVFGNSKEIRKAADDLDVINAAGRQAYLMKAGEKLSEEKLVEMMEAETWLTAEQCIEFGLADKFAEKDADMAKAKEILQKSNMSLEQRINIQKSLAAQLRELTEIPFEVKQKKEEDKEETGNIMQMLAGFFNN